MPKKRKRRAVNWTPVLGVALAINVVAGLMVSPATAVRHVRVQGAQPHDRNRLGQIVQSLRGVPFGLVRAARIESLTTLPSEVRSASLGRNLFGRAILRVEYREPVVAVAGVTGAFLDRDGVPFRSQTSPKGVRKLQIDPKFASPGLSLAAAWPAEAVAHLSRSLASKKQLDGYAVRLDATGRLWLNREGSGQVALGGAEALDEKIQKLGQLIAERPNLLSRVKSLNLTDPARPALVPLARGGIR